MCSRLPTGFLQLLLPLGLEEEGDVGPPPLLPGPVPELPGPLVPGPLPVSLGSGAFVSGPEPGPSPSGPSLSVLSSIALPARPKRLPATPTAAAKTGSVSAVSTTHPIQLYLLQMLCILFILCS